MIIFYIFLNIFFPYHNVVIPNYIKTNGYISTFCFVVLISSPTNSVLVLYPNVISWISNLLVLENLHLFLFLNTFWFFFFMIPPSKVMWYLWLYLLLLNCSTYEVLWFLNLYFLLLSYPIGPYFWLFILAQYLYTCWTTTNEIWKILLISFQFILPNFFISFMLN